jgi:heme/copper-type cytochrome/quinol oxidase subunit 2
MSTNKRKTDLIVGILVPVASGLFIVLMVFVWRYNNKRKKIDEGIIVHD